MSASVTGVTRLPIRRPAAGWLVLLGLLVIVLAGAALRFYALGQAPPGLYRDEAFDGLDALKVLDGARPLYFPADNGREPLYIYLVALAVARFGREPFAVRLPAAVIGTLTIPAAYAMARAWFPTRRTVALSTAALVAFTFWPLHLSRIGFRVVGLPLAAALLLAALGLWLHPHGRTRQSTGWRAWLWPAVAGALLGLSFYTYLAARLIPLALALFALWAWRAGAVRATWREVLVAVLASLLVAAPLGVYAVQQPEIVFGRAEQVSVFSPAINGGDLPGTLVRHTLAGLGMFVVRGDAIPRHNLPGRPVFDPLVAVFFVVGVLRCLKIGGWAPGAGRRALGIRNQGLEAEPREAEARSRASEAVPPPAPGARRPEPGAALVLLWTGVMLAPTILAEDTPHFLRAAGVLPVVCLLPALGLDAAAWTGGRLARLLRDGSSSQFSYFGFNRGERRGRRGSYKNTSAISAPSAAKSAFTHSPDAPLHLLIAAVLAASALFTVRDYFGVYAGLPKVATEFESAAVALAREARAFPGDVYVSARLWRDFQSIPFMVPPAPNVHVVERPDAIAPAGDALVLVWPHDPGDPPGGYIARLPAGRVLGVRTGPLAQGDLEPDAYPLYVALSAQGLPPAGTLQGGTRFAGGPALVQSALAVSAPHTLTLALVWYAPERLATDYTVYVHVLADGALVAGADAPPGAGYWPTSTWRAGEVVRDEHVIALPDQAYDPAHMTVVVGLYGPDGARLPVLDPAPGGPADGVVVP